MQLANGNLIAQVFRRVPYCDPTNKPGELFPYEFPINSPGTYGTHSHTIAPRTKRRIWFRYNSFKGEIHGL